MTDKRRVIELAAMWWLQATDDLEVARRALDKPFASCFHSQQAVEKGAKCLLVCHQSELRKTHDIGELLEMLRGSATPYDGHDTSELEALSQYAVETRYPPGVATRKAAEAALAVAEGFLRWVQKHLPSEIPRALPSGSEE